MKYYLIAGEASGDLHGSELIKALKTKDPQADFRCWGGDLMQAAFGHRRFSEGDTGGTLVKHYRELAFMGFTEVLLNLFTILSNLRFCKKDIAAYKPDALIFIDYPGFNMRIAKWARKQGYRTHYYISPQIWAWKEGRIRQIRRDIDAMYVILPFEKDFYEKKHDYPVHYVGHPLVDILDRLSPLDAGVFREENGLDTRPVMALLPGSRKQEIKRILPEMLAVASDFPGYQFVIAGAPHQDRAFYDTFIRGRDIRLVSGRTYDLLRLADAALVTSGTATLETALLKTPQVVCYKGGQLSYQIARRLIRLPYISLVNLILDKKAVTELIQAECNPKRIKEELEKILDEAHRGKIISDYDVLKEKLGRGGAAQNTAQLIHNSINHKAF